MIASSPRPSVPVVLRQRSARIDDDAPAVHAADPARATRDRARRCRRRGDNDSACRRRARPSASNQPSPSRIGASALAAVDRHMTRARSGAHRRNRVDVASSNCAPNGRRRRASTHGAALAAVRHGRDQQRDAVRRDRDVVAGSTGSSRAGSRAVEQHVPVERGSGSIGNRDRLAFAVEQQTGCTSTVIRAESSAARRSDSERGPRLSSSPSSLIACRARRTSRCR